MPADDLGQSPSPCTQYRSGIHVDGADQRAAAERAKTAYADVLAERGYGPITTEIVDKPRRL